MKFLEIISSSLPNDTNIIAFESFDQLLKLNSLKINIQTSNASLDLDELLGNPIVISMVTDSGYKRFFHAYVIAAEDLGLRFNKSIYSLSLSGWLWYLDQNNNSRIFQDLDVLEIISQVFSGHNSANFKIEVDRKYDKRVYCVQFGETDYHFVSRLMEEEGLWFYIDHSISSHTVVITNRQGFPKLSSIYNTLDFVPDSEENRVIREGVQKINRTHKMRPLKVVLRDFDYHKPSYLLHRTLTNSHKILSENNLEWYDFGTGFSTDERGDHLASIQLKAFQAEGKFLYCESNALGICAGYSFRLSLHPDSSRNRGYKVISCRYFIDVDAPDNRGQGNTVRCEFVALADDVPFHPLRVTSKPHVSGMHSATVVGPKGSEVHTDNMSRIRVHFHWDRYKTVEEDASCWIRVSQAWAGKGWGLIAMPRVGQEVLITYVDGDLDRPLVTGIVYNGDNPPPYKLPERIRYTGIVSRSLRHGTPENASQITIDDLRGNERVLIHAERDYQKTVERNLATAVANNSTTAVAQTATTTSTNKVSINNNVFTATGRSATFNGVQFRTFGQSLDLTGTAFNAAMFTTQAIAFEDTYAGVVVQRVGWADTKEAMRTASVGAEYNQIGFMQVQRATAHTYTGHSQAYSAYNFSQHQNIVSIHQDEHKKVDSEKKRAAFSEFFGCNEKSKVGSIKIHFGQEQKRVDGDSSSEIQIGDQMKFGNLDLTINGNLDDRCLMTKKSALTVLSYSTSSTTVKFTPGKIEYGKATTKSDAEVSPVPAVSGGFPFSGTPSQTAVIPPAPKPPAPDAAMAIASIVSAAGPASVGIQGAQALINERFKTTTAASKPATPASAASTTGSVIKEKITETVQEKIDVTASIVKK
jgi:type VI secretion system secreted protein VgrG